MQSDKNVTPLPVTKKESGSSVQLVERSQTTCKHAHVQVDRALAELTCLDCRQRLNPIEYIARVAERLIGWEHERQRIIEARKYYAERKQCRCTKCGEMTEIRRVSDHERQLIRRGTP